MSQYMKKNGFMVKKGQDNQLTIYFCSESGEIEGYVLDATDAHTLAQELLEKSRTKRVREKVVSFYA